MENRKEFNNWVMQDFGTHIKISNDGTVTRINFNNQGFEFSGKNPLKLPKQVQKMINEWMEGLCKANRMAVWDCRAWEGYENTKVVY